MAKKKKIIKRVKKAKKAVKKATKKVKVAKAKIRRSAAKKASVKKTKSAGLRLDKIGEVTHYFPHVNAAAVLLLKDGLKVGDRIYIKGHTSDFKEKVESMQLDHVMIQVGKKAQEIGLKVKSRVRTGDSVYRI
ncbi:MAG: hypothetical protein WC738_03625 [Candidatus Omnitrophota bacterium]|jgi:putative protease